MKFRQGYWVHDRFMDVFMEVLKVQYVAPKYSKLKVRWWNQGQSGPGSEYLIDTKTQKVKITLDQYKNWRRYEFKHPT